MLRSMLEETTRSEKTTACCEDEAHSGMGYHVVLVTYVVWVTTWYGLPSGMVYHVVWLTT